MPALSPRVQVLNALADCLEKSVAFIELSNDVGHGAGAFLIEAMGFSRIISKKFFGMLQQAKNASSPSVTEIYVPEYGDMAGVWGMDKGLIDLEGRVPCPCASLDDQELQD